jgi:osmoprotectant transport system substrate-binding protein
VTIGSKNFTEQFILGQLYKQALEAKGYTVDYHESIGSSELIDTAFQGGKINFYPEYTGVIVADLATRRRRRPQLRTTRRRRSSRSRAVTPHF